MVKVLNCNTIVSKFELKSRYYFHLGKVCTSLFSFPAIGKIVLQSFHKHWITHEGWYAIKKEKNQSKSNG